MKWDYSGPITEDCQREMEWVIALFYAWVLLFHQSFSSGRSQLLALLHRGRLLPDVQSVTKQDLCCPIIIAGIFLEQDGAELSFFLLNLQTLVFFWGMIFIDLFFEQISTFKLLHDGHIKTVLQMFRHAFIYVCFILNAYCVVILFCFTHVLDTLSILNYKNPS